MRVKTVFIILLVSVYAGDFAWAQQPDVKNDSTLKYENIEAYNDQSRFTRFMYRLFFKPVGVSTGKKDAKRKTAKRPLQKPYSSFEGKTIRHINIETLDPFGFSIGDTIKSYPNLLSRAGNRIHIQSRPATIRNLLLIRQNQIFDSLLVKESERLIRKRNYVTDVDFYVRVVSGKSDSVDVFIRELDKWSIIPNVALTEARITFKLTEQNFLGLGHEIRDGLTWRHKTGNFSNTAGYFVPNIRNTYINSTFQLGTDEFRNSVSRVAIERPFYSSLTKWAGGVEFMHQSRQVYVYTGDTIPSLQPIKFNTQDYWAGYSAQLFEGRSEDNRTTRLVSAIRYMKIRYIEKPEWIENGQSPYFNEDFYLASVGISKRKYLQDKYVFKFGLTEDIPVGKIYSLTGGFGQRDNSASTYLGFRVASGNFHKWGYFGSNFELGSFINKSQLSQGAFTIGAIYFSGLREIGKWKFRQFVKPQLIIGINRFANDSLTINDGYGIDGFNSPSLSGTSRMLFTLQTQSYSPWDFIGFRFGPYLICSFGMLGNQADGFKNSRVYSQFGLGVLIKNESLVMNTFQLSIAFYPSIPGKGQGIFKLNPFETANFGFGDFEMGKPSTIIFQ
jgi:hypothetical protein